MKLQDSIVQKANIEIGAAAGEPYRILADGKWFDTGCVAWPLPPQSEGANTVLAELDRLAMRLQELMLKSGVLEELRANGLPLWHPSDELSNKLAEILKTADRGSEIKALIAEYNILVAPYEKTIIHILCSRDRCPSL